VTKVYVVVARTTGTSSFRGSAGWSRSERGGRRWRGGAVRVRGHALARISEDVSHVAVHDAVRPLTTPAQIDAVFAAAGEHGAALLALPVADTLKRVAADVVTQTVPRAGLWQAQTPQAFRRNWLADAYARRSEFGAAITAMRSWWRRQGTRSGWCGVTGEFQDHDAG